MYKAIALLKSRSDLTRDEFIAYYETHHVPLIRSLLPEICEYRRNFIEAPVHLGPDCAQADYDVITELWFADRTAFESAMARHARPEVGGRIGADEENFLDRAKSRMYVVEERGGEAG